jgi:hypothetical protein
MAKIILSPGFGSPFYGTFKQRFDGELIALLEERGALVSGEKGNPAKRKDIDARLKIRLDKLKIHNEPSNLAIVELASGTRFRIEEYDGGEYVITEKDLIHVVP